MNKKREVIIDAGIIILTLGFAGFLVAGWPLKMYPMTVRSGVIGGIVLAFLAMSSVFSVAAPSRWPRWTIIVYLIIYLFVAIAAMTVIGMARGGAFKTPSSELKSYGSLGLFMQPMQNVASSTTAFGISNLAASSEPR